MKTLRKDELYQNLEGFLKNKGVELKPGGYSGKIQKGCDLLSEAINTGQNGLARAKVEIDKKLEQLRQVIHEKTAPRQRASATTKPEQETRNQSSARPKQSRKRPSRKSGKTRKTG